MSRVMTLKKCISSQKKIVAADFRAVLKSLDRVGERSKVIELETHVSG